VPRALSLSLRLSYSFLILSLRLSRYYQNGTCWMTSRLTMAIPLTEKRSWMLLLMQSAFGCGGIAACTFFAYSLHAPLATAGFIYLLVVVIVSLIYGIWQATFVSLFAVSCLNYFFIPPVFSFAVADERDWIALVSFQVCALLVSRLSSREQKIARDANYQRIQMKKLYELSRGILLFDLHHPPGPQLVQLIRRIFLAEDVAIFDANLARLDHEGEWSPEEQQVAKSAYITDRNEDDRETVTTQRVIRIGTVSIGAMAIRGEIDPLIANSIASLAAIAFERHKSYEKESRAESAQQAEQLRVAVLDALAHAFKTPLTVICTASSVLLEMGTLDQAESELADLINEESVNLNQLCTRLLQTAKLEVSNVTLHIEPVIVSKLVKDVVTELSGALDGHPIELSIEERDTPLQGDRELLKMILMQYLDNAAKYSAPTTPIDITVRESNSELLLSVRNQGSLIKMQDRERVFERFYRGSEAKERAPGTGVGLSIVKKAAEAHRGHVWVISAEEEGTTFFLSMPKLQAGGY
jgi:two-component system sensor histidine kinase KdpD